MAHTRHVHWDEAQRLFARAIGAGAKRLGFSVAEWDCSGNCTDPYLRVTLGRPPRTQTRKFVVVGRQTKTPLEVRMWLRCNRCQRCLATRASLWRRRGVMELEASSRTWMGTLTFKPSERYRLLARASSLYGPGFDGLPAHQQYRLIERVAYREVQLYWKRVRKQSGVQLRYLMVAEAHADGTLHYHVLCHERGGSELRWKHLSSQWQAGFSKWKLCDTNPASVRYVTKYLTKAIASRTRASVGYGEYLSEREVNEVNVERNTVVGGNRPIIGTNRDAMRRVEGPRAKGVRGPPRRDYVTELTGVKNGTSLA